MHSRTNPTLRTEPRTLEGNHNSRIFFSDEKLEYIFHHPFFNAWLDSPREHQVFESFINRKNKREVNQKFLSCCCFSFLEDQVSLCYKEINWLYLLLMMSNSQVCQCMPNKFWTTLVFSLRSIVITYLPVGFSNNHISIYPPKK